MGDGEARGHSQGRPPFRSRSGCVPAGEALVFPARVSIPDPSSLSPPACTE